MRTSLLRLPLAILLALGAAAGAHAQSAEGARAADAAMLPVWNKSSGNIEAFLLLEPTRTPAAGARWRAGGLSLDAAFGLSAGDTLSVVCDRKTGLVGTIGNLANHCMLAALDGGSGSRVAVAGAGLSRAGGRLGMSLASGQDSLPAWLSPSGRAGKLDQNTLTLFGQKNVGREATVSIGGTLARARLIPAGEVAPELSDRWTSKSLSLGASVGDFGANIVGRVVDSPSQPGHWEGLGLGLTWRTPWSGQLTVGAENVVSRGKNPFSPGSAEQDEGTVPYVRYEQDL